MRIISRNLTFWVVLMALAGYGLSLLIGDKAWTALPAGSDQLPGFYQLIVQIKQGFIQLLRILVAPVVFISLVAGLANIRSITSLHRMGLGTLGYYLLTTAIAAGIGLLVVFYIHPWQGGAVIASGSLAVPDSSQSLRFIDAQSSSLGTIAGQLLERALVNPITAFMELNVLAIVVNALLIGLLLVWLVPAKSVVFKVIEQLSHLMHKLLGWVIWLTPFGVFAIMFDLALRVNGNIVDQLLWFALVVFGATLLHAVLVLPTIAWLASGLTPWVLLRQLAAPMLVAFSTSSSTATLPVSLKTAQDNLKVSRPVAGFVLPLGATMNMDGTALFEGVAAVFLAYLFGVELNSAAIIAVFIMAMVSSIGAPGMPSGSMSGMQMVLLAVGIPLEAIAILLLVERPLDTFRTAVNVQGDMVGALVVQRFLGSSSEAAVNTDETIQR